MQAGEVGKLLILDAQTGVPGNLASLAGGTATLIVANFATGVHTSYPATVGTGGTYAGVAYAANTYAQYTTTGVEFPTGGTYTIQLTVGFVAGGQLYRSPPETITVLAAE